MKSKSIFILLSIFSFSLSAQIYVELDGRSYMLNEEIVYKALADAYAQENKSDVHTQAINPLIWGRKIYNAIIWGKKKLEKLDEVALTEQQKRLINHAADDINLKMGKEIIEKIE